MPVYRADLPRTLTLVVALPFVAATTGAFARDLRPADTQNEDGPTVRPQRYRGDPIEKRSRVRHEIGVFHSRQRLGDRARGDDASAELIERIGKAE
ncbi:MAG: hypothetical protein JOZ74_04100 [Bradyrhizobium sp.]|nr:hypothetical protein [Bradyrhizobium sp.]